jgi:hypothetical protein
MYSGNDYPEPRTREDQLLNITDYEQESRTVDPMLDSFESIISDSDIPNYPLEPPQSIPSNSILTQLEPTENEEYINTINNINNFNSSIPGPPIVYNTELDSSIENLENIVATSTPINPFSDEPIDTNDLDTLFSPFGITSDTSISNTSIPNTSITSDTSIPDTSIPDIISLSDAEALIVLRETQTLEFVAKLRMLSGDQYPIIEPIINKIIDLIAEKNLGFDCETISETFYGVDTIIHLYDKTIHDQDKYTIIASFRESNQMAYQ